MKRLVLIALLASCTSGTTAIDLSVAPPPGQQLDSLVVTVGDQTFEAPMVPELHLLVPDSWADAPVHIGVEGVAQSATVATGAADPMIASGETTHVYVQLVPAGCPDICTLGDVRCEADSVATCEVQDSGCPDWSAGQACPSETPFCSDGVCSSTCSDECSTGDVACDGAMALRSCANSDSDSCLDWTSTACPATQVCSNDACVQAYKLTVVRAGDGQGTVTGTGINCGSDCNESYAGGTHVTLTAAAAADDTFTGWSGGGCSGTGVCNVTISAATTVTATFAAPCVCDSTVQDLTSVPAALVADSTNVYWVTKSSDNNPGVRIMKISTGVVATYPTPIDPAAEEITVDGTYVYWLSSGQTISRMPKNGGTITTFVTASSTVYVSDLVADGSYLYWIEKDSVKRRTTGSTPGPIETLSTASVTLHMAVDASYVVWTEFGGSVEVVRRVPKAGGTAVTMSNAYAVFDVAAAGGTTYALGSLSNGVDVFGISSPMGTPDVLSSDVDNNQIVADTGVVVWDDATNGLAIYERAADATRYIDWPAPSSTSSMTIALAPSTIWWADGTKLYSTPRVCGCPL